MKRLAIAFLFFAACAAARAQDLNRPLLLVAVPQLQGGYHHTALLAIPLGNGRHFGFILNRATDVSLARLYPEHPPSAKVADPVYLGGPQSADALFAFTRRDPGAPSMRVLDELYLSGHAGVIDQIIEETPNDARYFAGYVAWTAGELAAEIDAGYWYLGPADEQTVLRHDTASLWDELVARFSSERHASLRVFP
jgi:putative transcriptional regulator